MTGLGKEGLGRGNLMAEKLSDYSARNPHSSQEGVGMKML